MQTKYKATLAVGATTLLLACGSGTAVPKKRPVDYKTPSAVATVSKSPSPSPSPSKTVVAQPVVPATITTRKTEDNDTNTATGITPGAFCSRSGALGKSKAGKLYTCKTKPGDSRLRWR